MSPSQINAVVPFEIAGAKSVEVVVTHNQVASAAFSTKVFDTAPAIFTVSQNGHGAGAILNADQNSPNIVTYNTADNPAPKGSTISMFGTGAGLWNRTIQDGIIILDASTLPAAAVSLTIGGQPAKILYAGATPYEVAGMLQVNAVVPNNIGSGPQPVVLTIGSNNNASQQVTVAVK